MGHETIQNNSKYGDTYQTLKSKYNKNPNLTQE